MIRRIENLTGGQTLAALILVFAVGVLLRVIHLGFPLYGDELSTLWVVRDRSVGDVLDLVSGDAEITPPLYFLAAWLTTRLGEAPELIRLPAFVAGIVGIPLTYLLGLRTVGKAAGLFGAAVFALSPAMTYFSADGRAYSLMICLLMGGALAMLAAIRTGRNRWWVVFGACSVLAMYSHYTAAFVLLAQFGWLLWAAPEARRAGTLTAVVAALTYLPWVVSLKADLDSPTTQILELIQGSGFTVKRLALEQVVAGHPLAEVTVIPGRSALVAIGFGMLLALLAALARLLREGGLPVPGRGLALVAAMTLATPVAELILLVFGVDLFGARNLTGIWSGLPVLLGGLLVAAEGVSALIAAVLVLGGFAVAAAKSTEREKVATGYADAAAFIDRISRPGDVIVDSSFEGYTPVPITPLGLQLEGDLPQYQPGMPTSEPPFLPYEMKVPDPTQLLLRAAKNTAAGGRVFVVTSGPPQADPQMIGGNRLPGRWKELETKSWPGRNDVTVTVLESGRAGAPAAKAESKDQADHP